MSHRRALTAFVLALLGAGGWVVFFLHLSAGQAPEGENVLAVFPPRLGAAEIIGRLSRAPARQFVPVGFANAWVVQASDFGLARSLRAEGALLVLHARGPIHFALGCAPGRAL